jgi:hypothetical protein
LRMKVHGRASYPRRNHEGHPVRPGVDARECLVPPGSTVGDLLREAGACVHDQTVVIGPHAVEESHVLEPEAIVYLVPRVRNPSANGTWRDLVGAFRGDPIFREIVEEGRAIRDAERDDPWSFWTRITCRSCHSKSLPPQPA